MALPSAKVLVPVFVLPLVLGCGLPGPPGPDLPHRYLRQHPGHHRRQDLLQALRTDLHHHRQPGCGGPPPWRPCPASVRCV